MIRYALLIKGVSSSNDYRTYVTQLDIVEMAKYLNNRKNVYKNEGILEVRVSPNYEDDGELVFFPSEYNSQHFLETYEERLLEQHRIDQLKIPSENLFIELDGNTVKI